MLHAQPLGLIPRSQFDHFPPPQPQQQQLGDVSDIPIVGDFFSLVTAKATTGAEAAIPTIQAAIRPYVVASLILGLLGVTFGLAGYLSVRKANKAAA